MIFGLLSVSDNIFLFLCGLYKLPMCDFEFMEHDLAGFLCDAVNK